MRREAKALAVTGWVKNGADGSVQAVCEGEKDADNLKKRVEEFGSTLLKNGERVAVTVAAGETVEKLARRMAIHDRQVERFRVLNGLGPADRVKPGEMVKIVVE